METLITENGEDGYWQTGEEKEIVALWWAVLKQALHDKDRYPEGHKDSPHDWFNSQSHEPGSYLWIKELVENER